MAQRSIESIRAAGMKDRFRTLFALIVIVLAVSCSLSHTSKAVEDCMLLGRTVLISLSDICKARYNVGGWVLAANATRSAVANKLWNALKRPSPV